MSDRLNLLQTYLDEFHLDALVLNPSPTLEHLTGLRLHLMERPMMAVFPREGLPLVILPELEALQLQKLSGEWNSALYSDDPGTWDDVFKAGLQPYAARLQRVGVEPLHMRVLESGYLQRALPQAELVDATELAANLRLRKDEEEIALMRRAAEAAQTALLATLGKVRLGMSERQIAAELIQQILRVGSDAKLPFEPIVSIAENAANPHATPSDRVLGLNEVLLIDYGVSHQGYFSDITRTFYTGELSPDLKKAADLVYQANRAAREGGKAGMPAGGIDDLARSVIREGGMGEFFTHRTGHGLGRETHEAPYMFAGNPLTLEPGMVFTIEPGIYLPGVGGIRIEDDVVVRADHLESLTSLPRRVLPLSPFQ